MAIPKKHTRRRRATKTSSFGTNGRESHDASAYYSRALQPDESLIKGEPGDEQPLPSDALNQVFVHSSERMYELPDRSVHLMVTSPPYNVGKDYDQDLTLKEYTSLLQRVLTETFRVLVPGGRACVNIANLGRKPYIPLHSDVIEASVASGFFMRGEIIWNKSAGAGSSTAWGSWCSPSNPTLRDVHEYILVFQKPPFRRENPHKRIATITRDEFLEFTKSVWAFGPESARRVRHPAPFPEVLPYRLIQLYTYQNDVILDPFMGSGATAAAAHKTRRRWIGYETNQTYAAITHERVSALGFELQGV